MQVNVPKKTVLELLSLLHSVLSLEMHSRSHFLLLLVWGCLAHLVSFCFLTASVLKHPRTPVNALGITDFAGTDHEQLIKRLRSAQSVDEALLKSFNSLLFLCVFLFVVCDSIFTY